MHVLRWAFILFMQVCLHDPPDVSRLLAIINDLDPGLDDLLPHRNNFFSF